MLEFWGCFLAGDSIKKVDGDVFRDALECGSKRDDLASSVIPAPLSLFGKS